MYDAEEALGKICVEFQRLESHLKVAMADLLDPHDSVPGMIVTAQVSFKAILDLFGALYQWPYRGPLVHNETRQIQPTLAQSDSRSDPM